MKLHLNRLPKKWHPFMIIIGCGCVCLIGGYSFLNQKVKTPAVATVQKTERMNDGIAGVGGEGTPDYNEMLTEDNHDRAQAASQKGKSFISAPVGKEESLLEDVKTTSSPTQSSSTKTVPSASSQATSQTRTKDESKEIARLASYMEALRQASYKGGSPASFSFKWAEPQEIKNVSQNESFPKLPGAETLSPGAILYASNDLTVSSDVVGTPVLATIVHGPLKGAKVMGKFSLSGERLVVAFQSLTKDGVTLPFEGYGVNPEKAEAGVASHVNNHTLARWGAFAAASFLEGLGAALQDSGTTRIYGDRETVTLRDRYKVEDQIQIAGGKVGERVANQLEKQLDLPPTVTLYAGTTIGILIVNAK